MTHFADKILLAMKGRSFRDVAPEIGISKATLNRVVSGKTPDMNTYSALCNWLETPDILREIDGNSYACLHELQHSNACLVKPALGSSIVKWAADEIAALRANRES